MYYIFFAYADMSKAVIRILNSEMVEAMETFTKDAILVTIMHCGLEAEYKSIVIGIRDRMQAQFGGLWSASVAKHGYWKSVVYAVPGTYFQCTVGGLEIEIYKGRC